jgi:hypothetical protein
MPTITLKQINARKQIIRLASPNTTLRELARKTRSTYFFVYNIVHRRGLPFARYYKFSERDKKIVAFFKTEKTLEEVGQKFGMTRERVRQIWHRLGLDRQPIRRKRFMERLKRKERLRMARELNRVNKFQRLATYWNSGVSAKEISRRMGLKFREWDISPSSSLSSKISTLRKEHPKLFPRRRPLKFDHIQLSRLWKKGLHVDVIARKIGFKNGKSVVGSVTRYREKHPNLFQKRSSWHPRQPRSLDRKQLLQWSRIWKSGARGKDLIKLTGYARVYTKIWVLRKKYPNLFPRRHRR